MNDDPVRLVTTKPDAELAKELKQELLDALKPALDVATKIKGLGFDVQLNMGANAFNQVIVNQLNLIKTF